METLIAIGSITFAVVLIVRGEVSIRAMDRRYAQEFPAVIAHAQFERKLERRAETLREHCTREDLQFLAHNGSDFARARLKAIEAPKPVRPEVVRGRNSGRPVHPVVQTALIMGKHPRDRTQAEKYFMKTGYWPDERNI